MTIEEIHLDDRPNVFHFVGEPGVFHEIYGHKGGDRIFITGYTVRARLYGGEGRDYLRAGDATEPGAYSELDGGEGIDTVVGGSGKDYFIVNRTDDVVIDGVRGDDDSVWSKASFFHLPGGVENLTVGGSQSYANHNGRGNELNNSIHGSSGNNLLEGMAGRDLLMGYLGADTLVGGIGADRLFAGLGNSVPMLDYNRTQESCTRLGIDEVLKINNSGTNYRIDLSDIDANIATPGVNEVFTFIGEAEFGADATGQVRFVDEGDFIGIYVSTDADAIAEMVIRLKLSVGPSIDNLVL